MNTVFEKLHGEFAACYIVATYIYNLRPTNLFGVSFAASFYLLNANYIVFFEQMRSFSTIAVYW